MIYLFLLQEKYTKMIIKKINLKLDQAKEKKLRKNSH